MNYTRVIFGVLIASALMTSCFYDNEEELYEYYYQANPCDTVDITYDSHIEPIVRGQCSITGCHVAGGSGNGIFGSYENLIDKVDNGSFRQRIIEEQSMPPSGPLSDCQILQIEAWLDAGAPEN